MDFVTFSVLDTLSARFHIHPPITFELQTLLNFFSPTLKQEYSSNDDVCPKCRIEAQTVLFLIRDYRTLMLNR